MKNESAFDVVANGKLENSHYIKTETYMELGQNFGVLFLDLHTGGSKHEVE